MKSDTSRRAFLHQTAITGGVLMAHGLHGVETASAASMMNNNTGTAHAPILVVTQPISRDVNPRATTWGYLVEVLQRAGIFHESVSPAELLTLPADSRPIVLLAGNLQLTTEQRSAISNIVQRGGWLIGMGGTSGLDKVFGVKTGRPLMEGWIKVSKPDHPITAGLRSSLHVFGGYTVSPDHGQTLATVDSGRQGAKGSAIVENPFGQGRAILLAPDLIFSIVHIQQGVPVLQDGKPSPDDSAPFNDGELKAEDGFVLDWNRDRTPMKPDDVPVFLEPISDELREIILKSIFHAARNQGVALPVLWYWPRSLQAVGHISHDTDGNETAKAEALLKVMNRCGIKSTWCTLYPGGYPRAFYEALKKQGYEIALHYDARSGGPQTSWGKENLLLQHAWLLKEAGLQTIVSNKNHYTRWENRLDFLRWCEEVDIRSDQSRGPSKHGAIGFPLGGSQPYFPLDDEATPPRMIHVLEVNMLTQDLVVVCPPEYGKQLMDSVVRHHGVAHFLFHPAHILKPGVAEALSNLVDYGRELGLEWWTSRQIYDWERLRRGVKAEYDGGRTMTLRAAAPVDQATFMLLRPSSEPTTIRVNGRVMPSKPMMLHGFQFDAATIDLADSMTIASG